MNKISQQKAQLPLIAIVTLFITTITQLNAQSLSYGFEFGSGSSYMIENYESANQINYDASLSMGANFKYQPKDSYFGIKLNVLYISTLHNGITSIVPEKYEGEVSTITTSLLLEHLNTDKKLNLGYNFGFGLTQEDYSRVFTDFGTSNTNQKFMSISFSGILAYSLSDKSFLNLSPILLWTDPINSLRSNNWTNGREDLSLLLQIGYNYKLK